MYTVYIYIYTRCNLVSVCKHNVPIKHLTENISIQIQLATHTHTPPGFSAGGGGPHGSGGPATRPHGGGGGPHGSGGPTAASVAPRRAASPGPLCGWQNARFLLLEKMLLLHQNTFVPQTSFLQKTYTSTNVPAHVRA